ncbi:MAG: N-acetyltransferase [Chloroflexi bacterium]|nr:MAG: N-acetyltransferase [Chloroflexota bacterium]
MVVDDKLIRGERVALRPYEAGFTEDELRRMYKWSRDETVLRWSGGSVLLMSFEDFKQAFQRELRRQDKHSQSFGLLTDTGEFIGRLGYYNIDYRRREAELGIAIGEKEYWGRGYGTDAVKTLLAYIFEETDLERIYLYTYAENLRAQRSFEKCGFRKIGRNRRFSLERGSHDEIQMEIYRDEWFALQASRDDD